MKEGGENLRIEEEEKQENRRKVDLLETKTSLVCFYGRGSAGGGGGPEPTWP